MLLLAIQNPFQGQGQIDITLLLQPLDYAINIGLAALLGGVLALTYRHTHKGLSYSQAFTQTILLVCVIVAIVMMAIGNNLGRAVTLVGALSIIRFRTVVKDTRDTAFVFGALALGIVAGTNHPQNNGNLWLAGIGCGSLVLISLVLYATNFGALYKSEFILRFSFDQDKDSSAYVAKLQEFARRSNMLHIEPSGDSRSMRLTYDVSLEKDATAQQLSAALSQVPGVSDVVLIVSKNDVDY